MRIYIASHINHDSEGFLEVVTIEMNLVEWTEIHKTEKKTGTEKWKNSCGVRHDGGSWINICKDKGSALVFLNVRSQRAGIFKQRCW